MVTMEQSLLTLLLVGMAIPPLLVASNPSLDLASDKSVIEGACKREMLKAYKEITHFNWKEYAEELHNKIMQQNPWTAKVPHLDAKRYINALIEYVCGVETSTTLIISGPKDSGKSKGIAYVGSSGLKVGFSVFELNLKGRIDEVDVEKVINDLSWDITRAILNIDDFYEIGCVVNKVTQCRDIAQSWTLPVTTYFQLPMLTAVGTLLVSICGFTYKFSWRKKKLIFILFMLILLIMIVRYLPEYYHAIYFTVFLIQPRISSGNWETTFCCLNAIKSCSSHRPILIIRDVKNLQHSRLHKLFSILENRKDSTSVKFPVIIETSDNLWVKKRHSDTAKMPFDFFYLKPMSDVDGLKELVHKHMLFNENDYKNLYKQWFGGHIRFYLDYWVHLKKGESHDFIMHRLQTNAIQVIDSCAIPISDPELRNQTMSLLSLLKNNDFAVEMKWFFNMPYYEAVKYLIQCNLLYYYGDKSRKLIVQNLMLEVAIEDALAEL